MEKIRLETNLTEANGIKILHVSGEIDVYTAPQFKEAVNGVLTTGQKHLIINMENVSYMDSSGFGALLSATKRLRPVGGTVSLVNCNQSIKRILQITKLDTIFSVYTDIDSAIANIPKE
ncbi:MAG: STAS domain-containing protein [Armatimonadota bacterium]